MATIRIVDGPSAGMEFVLADGVAMAGRHAECAIPLPDPRASRNHAEFLPDGAGRYSIMDVGSSNGTQVNGIPLPPRMPRLLAGGDEIRIGRSTLRYFAGEATVPQIEIPGYELQEILAEGGMGSIYRGRSKQTGMAVAIKILHESYADNREFVNRFIQEARAAGRLSHPNIIKVYHVGKTADGRYFFTMELVAGSTLTRRIPTLSTPDAARMFLELADALEYAHSRGIIHRDIKPDNILISGDGVPKLTDLGIAVLDQSDVEQTGPRVLGTPHYMSPEQASGKTLTASTDIYSLGATFYHVFARHPVFDGKTAEEIMVKHVRQRPPSLVEANDYIPTPLSKIVEKTLEKNPANRFANAAALREALAVTVNTLYPGTADIVLERRPRLRRFIKPVALIAGCGLILALYLLLFT